MENKEALTKGIDALVSRLESTEAFVLEQAPEICKQMLYREITGCTIDVVVNFALAILCFTVCVLSGYYCYQAQPDHYGPSTAQFISGVATLLFGLLFACCMNETVNNLKYIYLTKKCPKLFLLKEFAGLVK